jgi:quinoprotein glucose dehydrogenase
MGPFQSPLQIPCTKPPWSTLTAIDMRSGKILWQHPLGQVRKYGVTIPAFFGWGGPAAGGPLMTASGLIFIGASTDRRFRAFDVRTGEEVWRADLPHPGMAVPLSYGVNGRQFVAIAAGSYGFSPSEGDDVIVAFALPNDRSGTGK